MSLEYCIKAYKCCTLPLTLVSFGSGGIRNECHSLRHVDLKELNYPSTTPHSTYHYDICILHVVKVIPTHIKRYYNKKKLKGPDLKKGNKVWLLYKNFKSR